MDLPDITLRQAGFSSPRVEVRDTRTQKGLGVYALCDFREGEVVEYCPVVLMQLSYDSLPAALKTLVFDWHKIGGYAGPQALALGYGSLYNDANPANLRFEAVDGPRSLIRLTAARVISAGEELTVNYCSDGGGPESASDWWFDKKGIKRLP